MHRRTFLQLLAGAGVGLVAPRFSSADVDVFDFALPCPSGNFSWAAAHYAWKFSQLAYYSADDIRHDILSETNPRVGFRFKGLPGDRIASFGSSPNLALADTQILAWTRDDCNLVAYRGTEAGQIGTGHLLKALDLLTDASYLQKKLPGGHKVHTGFYQAVESSWNFVEPILTNGRPTVFIGHSLGGALATYAAFRAAHRGYPVSAVYTFASPRVGNIAWASDYNLALKTTTFRFANQHDLVTRVPVRGWKNFAPIPDYRHVGNPIILWDTPRAADSKWSELLASSKINFSLLKAFLKNDLSAHLTYSIDKFQQQLFVPEFAEEVDPVKFIDHLTSVQSDASNADKQKQRLAGLTQRLHEFMSLSSEKRAQWYQMWMAD